MTAVHAVGGGVCSLVRGKDLFCTCQGPGPSARRLPLPAQRLVVHVREGRGGEERGGEGRRGEGKRGEERRGEEREENGEEGR